MLGWLAGVGMGAAAHTMGYMMSSGYRGAVDAGFSALKANKGLNAFRGLKSSPRTFLGTNELGAALSNIRQGGKKMWMGARGVDYAGELGRKQMRGGGRQLGAWAKGGFVAGPGQGARSAARIAGGVGAAAGGAAAMDFLNPWGLGWGD